MKRRARSTVRRRCVVTGCARQVKPGTAVCANHARTTAGKEAQRALHQMVEDLTQVAAGVRTDGEAATLGKFRQRAARGDFDELLDAPLQEVVWQAGVVRSLQDEIGALRVAAKRLLLEEEDPGKMALGVSRVTTALMKVLAGKEEIERVWRGEARDERLRAQREVAAQQKAAEAAERAAPSAPTQEQPEEKQKRYTIAQAVKDWQMQQAQERSERPDGGAAEEEIIDAFSEMRMDNWEDELMPVQEWRAG